ncbi:TonB-dependent receptor plug domain-containing protein [Paraburkholderia sp. SIMBA_030]
MAQSVHAVDVSVERLTQECGSWADKKKGRAAFARECWVKKSPMYCLCEPSCVFPRVLRIAMLASACMAGWPADARPATDPVQSNDSTQHADADLAALPLEDLMQVTVSTASRLDQPISDAPAAVVVLTATDIRDFGWRTLADAPASLPGLYVSYDRDYAYLGARGFQRPGDYNSRFLLLVDGVRINDAVYDQAPIGTDFPVDMDMVERIEYVPGPGSAVYGSNALFGVVNVITKTGKTLQGPQVAVAAGSFGEKRARASYGWHGSNGADVVLSASSYVRSGQDLYYPEFDTADQNHGVAQGLDYDRAQNFLAKFAYGDFGLSMAYGNRTKGVPNAPYGAIFDTPDSTTDTHSFINGSFHHAVNDGLQVFHYDIHDLISETMAPSGLYVFENLNRANANGAELSYEQRFAGDARIRASYSWQIARDSYSGAVLQNSPRNLAKLNLLLPVFENVARIGTEIQCVSSRLAEQGHAAGYCLGNVTIGSSRLIDHADVSFSVYNVANARYADPASPGFTQDVIAQQSREFLVKLVYGF